MARLGAALSIDLLPALVFCVLVAAELALPLRPRGDHLGERWVGNIALYAANAALALFLAPALVAAGAGETRVAAWPEWLAGALFLDFLGYASHRLFHWVPLLWRLHAVHHTDADVDATTSVRHHPLEFATAFTLTTLLAGALGVAPDIVAGYGAVALALQMLQHGNVAIPARLDRALGAILVTPGIHRIHHSRTAEDANANFGTVLSIWDRLFGSFRRTALSGGEPALFGVAELAAPRYQRLDGMLLTPLHRA